MKEVFIKKEENKLCLNKNNKRIFYLSGKSYVDGRWASCGWQIEASSFEEASKIAESDKTYRVHSISINK